MYTLIRLVEMKKNAAAAEDAASDPVKVGLVSPDSAALRHYST